MSAYNRKAFKYIGEEEFSQNQGDILFQLINHSIQSAASNKAHDIYRRTTYLENFCDSLCCFFSESDCTETRQLICDAVFTYYLLSMKLYSRGFGVDMYDSIEVFDALLNNFNSIKSLG